MSVEGTQLINRPHGDLGVPARATSLSSSSTAQPRGVRSRAPTGEEESLRPGLPVQDSITLSELATSETAGADNHQAPGPTVATTEQTGETVAERAGVPQKIKQSIEQSQKQEQEKLHQIAKDVNERLNDSLSLRFRRDEETGEDIFQLVEQDTGDVVRQIPAEEVLEFMKKFEESLSGLIFSQQA